MTQVCTGSFQNVAGQPFFIPLKQYVSEFRIKNLTRSGVTANGVAPEVPNQAASDRIVEAFWCDYMTSGTAQVIQTGTAAALLAPMQTGYLPQNGITVFNAAMPPVWPVIAVASFVPGTTTVWTTGAAHGFQVGDNVKVYGLTSAPQFSGLVMTVTAVGSPTTFTTLLDSTGATTSVGSVQKVGNYLLPYRELYYPANRVIAKITLTNPMVVTTLVQQNYHPGDVVTFDIPTLFGIPQLSNRITGLPFQATVISANNAVGTQTVTLAVNAAAFGPWVPTNSAAWPLAVSYPFSFPVMVPQGEGNLNNFSSFGITPVPLPYGNQDVLSFARQNQAFNGVIVGAGSGAGAGAVAADVGGIIGDTVDVWQWRCISSLQEFPQPLNLQYV